MERPKETLGPILRRVLAADAVLEAVIGVVLLGLVGKPHVWLDVDRGVTLIAAGVFLGAAIAVAVAAALPRTSAGFVRQLAFANVAGGLTLWAVLALQWDDFRTEGRWLVAAAADAFVLIGLVEVFALRRDEAG